MKKIIFILLVALLTGGHAFSQSQKPEDPRAVLSFDSTNVNMGTIDKGVPNAYIFYFINTGKQPATISNVTGNCSCLSFKWPVTPIGPTPRKLPIKVTIIPTDEGPFEKKITVAVPAANPGTYSLTIRGVVK